MLQHLARARSVPSWALVLGLAAAHLLLQTWQLATGTRYVVSHLTSDDTYYYLQTAWATWGAGFVTFDGLHATNGVQLPWFGIVLVLALLAPTKTALLYATLVTCCLLNACCYPVIWRIAALLRRPALGWFMASLWTAVSLTSTYAKGLENSLHALVFWCVLWQVLTFFLRVRRGEPPNLAALTIVLVLNGWVRLDAALFSAILYAACIAKLASSRVGAWRSLAVPVAVSATGALCGFAAQLATFWLMAGSFLPISAVVKSSGAGWHWDADSIRGLIDALSLSVPEHFPPPAVAFAVALLVLAVEAASIVLRKSTENPETSAVRELWIALLVGVVAYHVVIVGLGIAYPRYFVWYRSPLFLFWILTFALPAARVQAHLEAKRLRGVMPVTLAVSLAIFLVSVQRSQAFVKQHAREDSFPYTQAYDIALWLSETSPPETVFASWNAGELGFFSNRTFVNLDGLVNNIGYYETVLRSPTWSTALTAYLHENRVGYIVDFIEVEDEPIAVFTADLPVVRRFSRRLKWGYRIWQMPSGERSAPTGGRSSSRARPR